MPFAPVAYFREGCDHVRRACEAINRDPTSMRYTIATVVSAGTNDDEIRRRAIASGQDPETVRDSAAAGTPDEVIERIRAFEKEGAETVYLQYHTLDDPDHLRLIGEAVLPHV
jgi:alkanesulfonate monooxygenase SsuD/methylene tetrahydromethanopterin reductase-like flavin-dependent oxidoreductase (luciferase family)